MKRYRIVRFEFPDFINPVKVVKTGLTLEEAQKHCSDPNTHVKLKWFDGYEEEVKSNKKSAIYPWK